MLTLSLDKEIVNELIVNQIKELVSVADYDLVFWDANELKRRTCMSWNFIQEQFFFDQRFPKFKVNSKWYFPAKETKEFLEQWIREQNINS